MLFAWLMRLASRFHEPLVAGFKQNLFAGIAGRVLEIGAGDGVNLKYFGNSVQWTGYEPNPWLARRIPVPEGGKLWTEAYTGQIVPCDVAVCTLVLCSVSNPRQVLEGIYRSLPSGGRLLFVEHVAAPRESQMRCRQDRWTPIWSCFAGGCHPNRETVSLIEAAGFVMKREQAVQLPLWLASPHVIGEAIKP